MVPQQLSKFCGTALNSAGLLAMENPGPSGDVSGRLNMEYDVSWRAM